MAEITIRIPPTVTPGQAYEYGFQCGEIGVTIENCHFSIFSTPENTKEWERGKTDALAHLEDTLTKEQADGE